MQGSDLKRLSAEDAQTVCNIMTRSCETHMRTRYLIRRVPRWMRPAWMRLHYVQVCKRINELGGFGCHP